MYFDLSVCFTISGETIGDIDIDGLCEGNLFSIESLDCITFL